MNHTLRSLVLVLLASALVVGPSRAQPIQGFKIVVNATNPNSEISRSELSRFFLKKTTRWAHGETVEPVDLDSTNSVRKLFTEQIHGKEVRRIQSYWQRLIFSGRATRPPELDQESQVLEFVARHRQAIGYVSAATAIGKDVKVVKVTD